MFGIQYISLKKDVYTEKYSASAIETIVLNNRSYNVYISTSSDDNISARLNANTSGFVAKSNSVLDIQYELSGDVLTIIGYDKKGPKEFVLNPEAANIETSE